MVSTFDRRFTRTAAAAKYPSQTSRLHAPRTRLDRTGWPPTIEFRSNDYLGLSWQNALPNSQEVFDEEVLRHQAWGSGASPLVTGRTLYHNQLEQLLAEWKEFDGALTFSSGYATNVSTIAAIARKQDILFSDELNHASLIDGCRLAKAQVTIYRHADLNHLDSLLRTASAARNPQQGFWIVSDTVFSMEGDTSDVQKLVDLAKTYDAGLILDEAHAVGVLRQTGTGTC